MKFASEKKSDASKNTLTYLKVGQCFCSDWLQKECQAFRSSLFSLVSLHPANPAAVNVTGIQFYTSVWSFHGCDVFFFNCVINLLKLLVFGRTSISNTYLKLSKTQIGASMYIENAIAVIENCHLSHTVFPDSDTCIMAVNTTITVASSHITRFEGGTLIQINNGGTGYIRDVKFEDCSSANVLIGVQRQSTLSVLNSTFLHNKNALIDMENSSVGIIKQCIFKQNIVVSGKIIPFVLRCVAGGVLAVNQSVFENNTVTGSGGALGYALGCVGFAVNSEFKDTIGRSISAADCWCIAIKNCTFQGNSAAGSGAGVRITAETGNKTNIFEDDKKAKTHGQGDTADHVITLSTGKDSVALNFTPRLEVKSSTFIENTAGNGGAIAVENVSFILTDNLFVNNSATGSPKSGYGVGGAVMLKQSPTIVTNCLLEGNQAFYGGAIGGSGQFLVVNCSTFTQNKALFSKLSQGGAIYVQPQGETQSMILNSSFYNNSAATVSGAIGVVLSDEHFLVQGSTFQGNTAASGGAICCSPIWITNSLFDANCATSGGGGALYFSGGVPINISFSHFMNNTASFGGAITAVKTDRFYCNTCSFKYNTAHQK